MDHEVKYVPEGGSGAKLVPSTPMRRKLLQSQGGYSLVISALALIIALVFFTLVFSWLWDIPETAKENLLRLKNLEEAVIAQSEQLVELQRDEKSCSLPKKEGVCFSSMPRWYMKPNLGDCHQFMYSGCGGNGNNFHTYDQCMAFCKGKTEPRRIPAEEHDCSLEPTAGPCRAVIERFYYDKKDNACKTFFYGGCAGNTNNFLTRRECEDNCLLNKQDRPSEQVKTDVCSLESDPGPCRAGMPRWYFDMATGTCKEFLYGGCDGNENNFQSEAKCKERCVQSSRSDDSGPLKNICTLPSDTGMCRALIERFFYNSKSGKCETFIWGGCGGNENSFETLELCQATCQTVAVPRAASLANNEIPSFMFK